MYCYEKVRLIMVPTNHAAPIRRIAIACPGGGSQTTFTAGVLQVLLREAAARKFVISQLSGASGAGDGGPASGDGEGSVCNC
jgi:predicted acylesterase/phospholipase RssA